MPQSPHILAGLVVVTFAAITTACAEQPIESPGLPVIIDGVYDQTADFTAYQTYDLVEFDEVDDGERPRGLTQANRRAVRDTIVAELSDRGLAYDDSDPDLRIAPFVRQTEVTVVEEQWWWDSYWGWYWGYAVPWYDRDILELDAGTLVIDAVDVGDPGDDEDDMLVFRATATALMPTRPVDWPERITDAVEEMFEYWPSGGPA